MAKKQNKISVNKIDKIIDFNRVSTETIEQQIDGETITIEVYPNLTLKERGDFVNNVVGNVFDDGVYAPYALNFTYKFFLLDYCTNLTMPKDVEKVNRLMQSTDIADRVEEIVNDKYLYSDILDFIEYRKNVYLKNNKADEFIGSLTSFIDNMNKISESDEFKDMNLKDLVGAFDKFKDANPGEVTTAILDFNEEKAKRDGETE